MSTIKTRIQLKYDTEEHWGRALNFIPMRGEVIIYSPDDTRHFCRFKVGDGSTPVVDLPFMAAHNLDSGTNYNTTQYWNAQLSYIPSEGEIIVYSDYNSIEKDGKIYKEPAIKIGDGTTYVVDLPFIDDIIRAHIQNAQIHVSSSDREFWGNKINCNDAVEDEILEFTRM